MVKKQDTEISRIQENLAQVNQQVSRDMYFQGKAVKEPGGQRPPHVVPIQPPGAAASTAVRTPERPFSSDLPYGSSRSDPQSSPNPSSRVSPSLRRLGGVCREWLETGKCDKPGCTYRHEKPPPNSTPRDVSERICAQYLATGKCTYEQQNGRRCRYKHVAPSSVPSGMVASVYLPDVRADADFYDSEDDDDPGERSPSSADPENAGV